MIDQSNPTTIVIERELEAPRALVFEAWSDPKHLVHWYYASEGWTTPFADVDLRVGGEFRIGFCDPDNKYDFVFGGTFTEVTPPSRIAYTMGDGRRVTVDFTAIGKNRTHVRLAFEAENTFPIELQRNGWGAQVAHLVEYLGAYLVSPPKALPELSFTRTFNAPRAAVFQAWVDVQQLSQWWGPEMFTIARATMEPRVGGPLFIEMKGPDGTLYPVKGKVVDYVENERLVYTGQIIETAPGVFEMEAVTSLIFTEAGPGKTQLVVRERVTKATEKANFALAGMEEGFRQMLGKLERFLSV